MKNYLAYLNEEPFNTLRNCVNSLGIKIESNEQKLQQQTIDNNFKIAKDIINISITTIIHSICSLI